MKALHNSLQVEDRQLRSSRIRLALVYAFGMAVSLCVVMAAGYWIHTELIKRSLRSELQSLAGVEADVHLKELQQWAAGELTAADVEVSFRPHRTSFYYILSSDLQLVHGNETQPELRSALLGYLKTSELPSGTVVFRTLKPNGASPLRLALLRHPVLFEGEYLGSVYAATDVGDSLSYLEQMLRTSLALALGLVLLASIGGWWMAHRSMLPLRLALHHQRQFIADVSHELRAPLTVMTTALTLIRKEAGEQLSEFHQQTLSDALDETKRLNRMTEELLLLARADAGELKPRRQSLLISPLVDQRIRLYRPQLEQKGIRLEIHAEESLRIEADPDLLSRLLTAALDNAVKYTPLGGALRLDAESHQQAVRIRICNTSAEVSTDQAQQLFKRFYRGDPSRSRNQQGAGLGLALIQEIMLAHGGEARVTLGDAGRFCLECRFPVSVGFQK